MPRARPVLAALTACLALCLPPSALPRSSDARQYLDRHTGATVTSMARPLIFARERPSLAVNARDYLYLAAVDVNRAGAHELYWYGYAWSTIDHRSDDSASAGAPGWLLLADGRPIPLVPVAVQPSAMGIDRPPIAAPGRNAQVVMFRADREMLGYVAGAAQLSLQRADGSDTFMLWRDARAELKALLQRLGP